MAMAFCAVNLIYIPGAFLVNPSVSEVLRQGIWRRASRNTALSVRAVRIANGEYQGCPPRVVRGAACQAAIASSVNQTVKLPRWRKLASYAAQLVTLRFCLGIWWRRAALALNGMAGSGSEQGVHPIPPKPTSLIFDP